MYNLNIKISENKLRNIIQNNKLSKIDWYYISIHQKLSEEFIREFKNKVNWDNISVYQKLSEDFIKEFQDKIIWYNISKYQKLSESFIKEFQNKVDWYNISKYQKLSEEFIREFQDKIDWSNISMNQKLSEEFIKKFKNEVDWSELSLCQKLSEKFIREFQNKVDWKYISKYQKLSENFIKEFQDKVNWYLISKYQKLSKKSRKEFNLKIPETCWLYKSPKNIEKYIKEHTKYEIVNGEVIAYKSCRSDEYSTFNFQYKYEVGKEYESHADCNIDDDASFGLSAWTKKKAIEYCNEKLFKVGIKLKDIAAIVQDNKIRARKIRIIKEIK
jgi:phosphoribosylanthranilate isomerase